MLAAVVTRFGGPEALTTQELPDPAPGPGEVVVEVEVADVLWVETAIRRGEGQGYFDHRPPYVPGNGVAGRVGAVGDGVDPAWMGRAVLAHTGNRGGYAERAAVPVGALAAVPEGLDLTTAAALLHDAPTALALADGTGIDWGDPVLVVGASGGLGLLSVQLALDRGARVVAVARDERKIARIEELGADAVIDSERPGWVERARAALGGAGADVILDNVGGEVGEAAFAAIAPGGRFSGHGTPSGRFAAIDPAEAASRAVTLRGIEGVQQTPAGLTRLTERALALAAEGRIRPVIGQTFPLSGAAQAHAAIEGRGVFGKTLLLTGA